MKKLEWLDETCNNCDTRINSWDKRISKVLAYKSGFCTATQLIFAGLSESEGKEGL